MASLDLNVTISNSRTVTRLAEAVAAFVDLYENNGYETDEGRELKEAMADLASNLNVCQCGTAPPYGSGE